MKFSASLSSRRATPLAGFNTEQRFLMQRHGPFVSEPGNIWQFLIANDSIPPLLFSDLLFRAILSGQGRDYRMRRSLQTGMSLRVGRRERERGGGWRAEQPFRNNANVTAVQGTKRMRNGEMRLILHTYLSFFLLFWCIFTILSSCVISQNKHLHSLQPRLSVQPGRLHPISGKKVRSQLSETTTEAPEKDTTSPSPTVPWLHNSTVVRLHMLSHL